MIKNSNQNIEKKLLSAIKIGFFLILLTPLIISPWSVFPTLFPKIIYFRILIEIIFIFYILLLILNRDYLPRISPIFISSLIFTEVLALSTWKSINPWRSFWGTMERGEGFLTFLHLFVFFLILVSVFKTKKEWLSLLRFTVFLSIPMGLAGIIQKMKIFHFYGSIDPVSVPRISATLGNPVFYGSYLVLIIFLAIFLSFFDENKKSRIFFLVLAVLNSVLLLLTGTRSAWIGVFGGGFLLFFIRLTFFSSAQKEKRKIILFFLLFFSLFFLIFLLISEIGYLPKTVFLERYQSLFSNLINFKDPRVHTWKLGIDVWRTNPTFGFGLESFSFLYDKNYRAAFLPDIPKEMLFDRVHNQFIDTLVTSGIIGLVSYLVIFGSAIFLVLKYSKKFTTFLAVILITLFLAYFGQSIFTFDTISSCLILFFILGFIDVNFRKEEVIKEGPSRAIEKPFHFLNKKLILFSKIGILIFSLFLILFTLFFVNIQPFLVSARLNKGRELLDKGQLEKAIESLDSSIIPSHFTNFEATYYSTVLLFNSTLKNQKGNEELSKEFQKLAQSLEDHLEGKPEIREMNIYLLLAEIYKNLYFVEKDTKFLEAEERILGKALRLNDQVAQVYRLAGKMRFLQKREEEGMVFFTKAFELDKDYVVTNEWIGESLIEAGEKKRGAEILRKAMKMGGFYTKEKFNLNIVWKLADLYEELGDFQELSKFYEETIKRYPKELPIDPQLFASLATVYAKIGEKEKARQTIEEMIKLYPYLRPSAEEFLSNFDKIQ